MSETTYLEYLTITYQASHNFNHCQLVIFMSEFMAWLVNSTCVLYKLWQTEHILH